MVLVMVCWFMRGFRDGLEVLGGFRGAFKAGLGGFWGVLGRV